MRGCVKVSALDGRKRELEEETRRMSKHERQLGVELDRLGAREAALVAEVQRLATHEALLAATVDQLKGEPPHSDAKVANRNAKGWHRATENGP